MHPRSHEQARSAPQADTQPARRWLRTKEAARHLGVGAGTLTKLRCYGGGPRYAKLGHAVVYDPGELDRWAADRIVASTSEPVRTR